MYDLAGAPSSRYMFAMGGVTRCQSHASWCPHIPAKLQTPTRNQHPLLCSKYDYPTTLVLYRYAKYRYVAQEHPPKPGTKTSR